MSYNKYYLVKYVYDYKYNIRVELQHEIVQKLNIQITNIH